MGNGVIKRPAHQLFFRGEKIGVAQLPRPDFIFLACGGGILLMNPLSKAIERFSPLEEEEEEEGKKCCQITPL